MKRGLILLLLLFAGFAMPATEDDQAKAVYAELIKQVSLPRLQKDIEAVESYGSRLAGSKGEQRAFDYAEERFRALGLRDIHRDPFKVTVPDPGAIGTLNIGGKGVAVWPLWPNLARTSTCSVRGPLVYGGFGRMEDFQGLNIRGSIVVLEFNSGSRWRNAAKLGAKAIIFLEPDEMPRAEAEAKFVAVPLDVPRFYLPLKDSGPVLRAAQSQTAGNLECRQNWVSLPTAVLTGTLPGSDPKAQGEPVVLVAYPDANSIVPGMAPGADSLGGYATLLEMAKIWSHRPHRRPIRFVLAGAHHQGLQGVRQYVENLIQRDAPGTLLTLTLDISSGSRAVGAYSRGWFFEYRDEPSWLMQDMARLFRSHADKLAEVEGVSPARLIMTDAVNQGDSRTWKNNIPGKFGFDCEPLLDANMNALTFATIEDGRERVDTPLDTMEQVNLANILRQAETVAAMLHHALNDTSSTTTRSDYRVPLQVTKPVRMSLYGGFATVRGQIVSYDPQKSFVPDISVPESLAIVRGRQKTMMGVRGDMIQLTEGSKSQFAFYGCAPITAYWGPYQTETNIAGFHVDPASGQIDYAASLGFFGDFSYPTHFMLKVTDRQSPLVVFKCVSVAIYDLVDPQDLQALASLRVLDSLTDAEPTDYGIFAPPRDQRLNPEIEDAQVVFLPPKTAFKLLGGSAIGETRLILTNSSVGDEVGKGYYAPGGPTNQGRASIATDGLMPDTSLNTAVDISAINQTRLNRFHKYRIISKGVEDLHAQAEGEIAEAQKAQTARNWAEADRHARAAWGFALRAHPVIQKTANDVVNGVVFYLFLLMPFSYFLERLIFANRLLTKQLGVVIGIFLGSFVLLRLIHPAFEIVSNPAMIFVAFVMGALSLIVITFILGKFESSLRVIKQAQSGVTEVDIRRASVAMAAFNLGVSNMRRRKARTFLTTLTLVVMTFIVLSFTSIVSELALNEYPSPNEARYSGILIRNPGMDPLQLTTFRQIQSEFSRRAAVARRAYYYGADIGDTGILTLQRADRVAEVRAMLGLEPIEQKITRPQEALLPGGRWFRPGEQNVMILPAPLAETLKVDAREVGKAKVKYAGVDYTVIGIVDPSILRATLDLDGDGIMPPDFSLSSKEQQQSGSANQAFRKFIRLDPTSVFIVPAETALGLGADLRSVGIEFDNPAQTRKALNDLMPRLRLNLYAAVESDSSPNKLEVKQFSVFQSSKGTGLVLIFVQLVIAASFVFSTMLASVYERTREIAIFSSIGLAPNHIAMLFFAESLVYGILGAVFGYYVAQGTAKFIVATGALPGLTLNFSSTSAVMSAGIVMAVVLLSTIYPSRKAAQIAAPAMNEEVFETDPVGDEWTLPLPFSISATEAAPLMQFLGEWFRAYEEYTIGEFVTSGTKLWATNGEQWQFHVETTTWLTPYDLGISQLLDIVAKPSNVPGIYSLDVVMTRLAGDPENWPTVNRRFLANVRKQFLTWRTLTAEQRAGFEERAREQFGAEQYAELV